VRLGSENTWAGVAAGWAHSLGVKTDGSLWAWGMDDISIGRTTPGRFGAGASWVSVGARYHHTVALKSDGTLWAWGANYFGQLGDGTTGPDRSSPVQVGSENSWSALAAGGAHTLALKTDGSLWAWGYNEYGQLGDGTTVNKNTPVQVGTANDWVAVAAGGNHTIALKQDGSLWAWGRNGYGQLGDGTTANKPSPMRVGTADDWALAAAGGSHTLAVKTDGSLWAWGANDARQLGHGSSEAINPTPLRIGSENSWAGVTAGESHTLALTNGGSLWAWGANENGQLGGGTAFKNEPVRVLLPPPDSGGDPTIHVPGTLIVEAEGPEGAVVTFAPKAQDPAGNPIEVVSTPASGSLFPLGGTTVICTATDADGRTATASFLVIVTMNLDRAAGEWIAAAEGGTLATPDGSVGLIIPPGALVDDTFLSIAARGTSFELTTNLGNGIALFGVLIQPEGLEFLEPVTLIFHWPDEDDDGVVDGTFIRERNLVITQDNVVVTERCHRDMAANTFTLEVASLSEFCLAYIDDEGPLVYAIEVIPLPLLVNTPAVLTAVVDDTTTGDSPIGGAAYSLDGEEWVTMSAVDGAFDEPVKAVTATLPPFAAAGFYRIEIWGADAMFNEPGPIASVLLPVYDPSAGFVTGGGWIDSPAGAFHPGLAEFASVTGKASLGFVARYKKGANVPDGNTEFQFRAGDLNFKSNAYQWLVVAGARAQYKGWGTINGEGDYGFLLTAIDGDLLGGKQPDRFRIRIWQTDDGTVVYDNQSGAADDADLTDATILRGGSIMIHAK
jgi:hypothetical protein